jgi:hypothetical protein
MIAVMQKFLTFLLILLIFNTSNANELENTLNKVYDKGSDVAENYISNLLVQQLQLVQLRLVIV